MTPTITAPAPPQASWGSGITAMAEHWQLERLLAEHANRFLEAASWDKLMARTGSITKAMELGHALMNCCTEMQDLHMDLTGRLPKLVTA